MNIKKLKVLLIRTNSIQKRPPACLGGSVRQLGSEFSDPELPLLPLFFFSRQGLTV